MNSWWVIAFFLFCAILYEQGLKSRDEAFKHLRKQQHQLQDEKTKALAVQDNLKHQINSQSDPSYVELTLMKGLGLTPENQQKVFFDRGE